MKKYNLSVVFLLLMITLHATSIETQKRDVGAFTSIRSSTSIDIIVEQTGQYSLEVQAPERYWGNIKTEVSNGELHVFARESMNFSGEMIVYVQVKDLEKVLLTGSGDFETKGELRAPEFTFRVSGSGDLKAELNSRVVVGILNASGDAKISGITESLDIQQSGSGDLIASRLHLITGKLRMSGSGDSKFTGSSDNFELSQSGSGDFSGREFEIENAKIRKSSSGDARVYIEKSIDVSLSGSGDLYYSGKPEFKNITVTGSGDIVKIK